MQHLYSVEGDFNLMLKWDDYFGQHNNTEKEEEKPQKEAKTDMKYVLLPWIVFWIAANIHTFIGSLISIFVCAMLPVLFFKNRKTVYDVLSAVMVSTFSILLLLNLPAGIIMTLSYLAFGLMWGISAFFKIPLTAQYSMNDYGEDKALQNPIFIKTNRILTAAWGVLYIITAVWTYFLMGTSFRSYTGIINSLLPILMGIFTAWFQKWYPMKVARGK